MSEIILTDSVMHDASDIAGVKDVSATRPEGDGGNESRVADEVKGTELSAAGSMEEALGGGERAVDPLEAEFDELIRGRFSEVYKKRTERIIRKRLRSGKAQPESTASTSDSMVEKSGEPRRATVKDEPMQTSVGSEPDGTAVPDTAGYEMARQINKNRPIENGLTGSSGMVTKINVSALDGKGVLSIIKRVGTGEKISFK